MCKFNSSITINATCKLSFINRLQKSLTVSTFVITPINEMVSRVQLYYKYRLGYKLFLIDVTNSLCDYINGKEESKVLDFIMPQVQIYSTPKVSCPYSGPFNIRNLPLNWSIFDYVFLPTGSFMFNLTIHANKYFLWNGKFYFTIPEGKTAEDDRMG